MKLVQILAKELDVWPDDMPVMAQDADGAVYAWSGTRTGIAETTTNG